MGEGHGRRVGRLQKRRGTSHRRGGRTDCACVQGAGEAGRQAGGRAGGQASHPTCAAAAAASFSFTSVGVAAKMSSAPSSANMSGSACLRACSRLASSVSTASPVPAAAPDARRVERRFRLGGGWGSSSGKGVQGVLQVAVVAASRGDTEQQVPGPAQARLNHRRGAA